MKFRRKSREAEPADPTEEESTAASQADAAPATGGPFDVADVEDGAQRIDLGSLLLAPEPQRDVRLQVNDQSQEVQAVFLAGPDGAVELRAFAAPRNGDLWSSVRPQLAADMARRGGTASEREGRWGPELVCRLTVKAESGTAEQPSRIIGINGPRWMLRATLIGRPAMDPDTAQSWEDTISRVVVRRGDHAMPVGDPLPLKMPAQLRPQA